MLPTYEFFFFNDCFFKLKSMPAVHIHDQLTDISKEYFQWIKLGCKGLEMKIEHGGKHKAYILLH